MTLPRKKLIEVAIPLEAINAASAREKSIRHGHPSTLHLWWARRPLAACRAVLFAQLVDDPSSHPDKFPTAEAVDEERRRLFMIIEDLVVWENSTNEGVLERARAEIRKSCGGDLPPVCDPFSGGGSIPLEAQRLGLPAYGSDLNPVAVMIGKAMIEIPSKFGGRPPVNPDARKNKDIFEREWKGGQGLAEDVRYYGQWMRDEAEKRIGHLYPKVEITPDMVRERPDLKLYKGRKLTVIALLWTRTVKSPNPAFADVDVPLASTFMLSMKKGKEAYVEPVIEGRGYWFDVKVGAPPDMEVAKRGTKSGGSGSPFLCLLSGSPMPFDYLRAEGRAGRLVTRLMAIVAEGERERVYLAPTEEQQRQATKMAPAWRPESDLPKRALGFRVQEYGMLQWADLFTSRQLVALTTFSDLVQRARERVQRDAMVAGLSDNTQPLRDGGTGAAAYADAVSVYLAFAMNRVAMSGNSFVRWNPVGQKAQHIFGRQAIPMLWDYAETNPLGNATGAFSAAYKMVMNGLETLPGGTGQVNLADAQSVVLTDGAVLNTDPPYYDNIGYADLSDFFYCWMKPLLRRVYPELFGVLATPKSEELVATPYRHGGKKAAESFFLNGMSKVITNIARQSSSDYPATIYYAFKQSEIAQEGISSTGWATFLQAVIETGYAVVGTWPIRTEMRTRQVAMGTNALANSVVLVCRKREDSAEIISRAEFIGALKRELPSAIEELQKANISPADMPQSAIGPGMGIFSRCKAVLEADDSPMTVKTALQLINRELDEYLGGIEGEFDADTRFAITWFEQNGLAAGDYGTANSIATARGISVDSVKHAGIVESAAGKVRILKRDEIDSDWDPTADTHLTVWECCQHLIRELEQGGELAAALLLRKIGPAHADAAKDLAYCLYDICANKRRNAGEAASYNGLIAVWSELTRQAAAIHDTRGDLQGSLEL